MSSKPIVLNQTIPKKRPVLKIEVKSVEIRCNRPSEALHSQEHPRRVYDATPAPIDQADC